MTSRWAVRGRARPTFREGKVTVRSVRPTRRRWARATRKTEGAREVKAERALCLVWLGTFQGMGQTWGAMASKRPAWRLSALQSAREMGESACTGTKKWAREGLHVVRSSERPPPGTMEGIWGWDGSCRPQVCRTPGKPGKEVPMKRSSVASRVRAVADAWNRAWYARR